MRRLSQRAQLEASQGGAKVWAEIIALAKPSGVINLGQGYPDFSGHDVARRTTTAAVSAGFSEQ